MTKFADRHPVLVKSGSTRRERAAQTLRPKESSQQKTVSWMTHRKRVSRKTFLAALPRNRFLRTRFSEPFLTARLSSFGAELVDRCELSAGHSDSAGKRLNVSRNRCSQARTGERDSGKRVPKIGFAKTGFCEQLFGEVIPGC